MNTIRTETPLEIDNRHLYRTKRDMLPASQRASRRSGQGHQRCPHRPPCLEPCDAYPNCKLMPYISFDNTWMDAPIGFWKALDLVLFVMAVVAGIARYL